MILGEFSSICTFCCVTVASKTDIFLICLFKQKTLVVFSLGKLIYSSENMF